MAVFAAPRGGGDFSYQRKVSKSWHKGRRPYVSRRLQPFRGYFY